MHRAERDAPGATDDRCRAFVSISSRAADSSRLEKLLLNGISRLEWNWLIFALVFEY